MGNQLLKAALNGDIDHTQFVEGARINDQALKLDLLHATGKIVSSREFVERFSEIAPTQDIFENPQLLKEDAK